MYSDQGRAQGAAGDRDMFARRADVLWRWSFHSINVLTNCKHEVIGYVSSSRDLVVQGCPRAPRDNSIESASYSQIPQLSRLLLTMSISKTTCDFTFHSFFPSSSRVQVVNRTADSEEGPLGGSSTSKIKSEYASLSKPRSKIMAS